MCDAPTGCVCACAPAPSCPPQHADMAGVPLLLSACGEAPMLGCAALAAVAAGLHDDVPAAVAAMVQVRADL
jgi:ribulose kinase